MWRQIRHGHAERVPNKQSRRAARLFGRLVRRASGYTPGDDEETVFQAVTVTSQQYVITSADAKEILRFDGDPDTDSGIPSETTTRVLKTLQGATKADDCDCETPDECFHGLVNYDSSQHMNRVTVAKPKLHAYLDDVATAVEDVDADASDDPGDSGEDAKAAEAAAEAADEMDRLTNNVVSKGDGDSLVSDADAHDPT
jgi:hypothetical protein